MGVARGVGVGVGVGVAPGRGVVRAGGDAGVGVGRGGCLDGLGCRGYRGRARLGGDGAGALRDGRGGRRGGRVLAQETPPDPAQARDHEHAHEARRREKRRSWSGGGRLRSLLDGPPAPPHGARRRRGVTTDPSRWAGGVLAEGWLGRGAGREAAVGRAPPAPRAPGRPGFSTTGQPGLGNGGGRRRGTARPPAAPRGRARRATGRAEVGRGDLGLDDLLRRRREERRATRSTKAGFAADRKATRAFSATVAFLGGGGSLLGDGAARSASTTRSSVLRSARARSAVIAIVSSQPGRFFRHRLRPRRAARTASGPGPTADSAIVSTLGVRRRGGRGRRAGRRGQVSGDEASTRGAAGCTGSITTSSSPGAPSQRMSPLRRTVPSGSSGLSLTCSAARGAGVVDAHAAGFHHDAGVVRARPSEGRARGGAGRGAERHGAALRENAARSRERALQDGRGSRLRVHHHTLAAPLEVRPLGAPPF